MRIRPFNILEHAECILDSSGSGNLNFAVIVDFKGGLSKNILSEAIPYLQQLHPLLSAVVDKSEQKWHWVHAQHPFLINEYLRTDDEQWKTIAKQELRKAFDIEKELLWRITLLQDEESGQLIFTFHHAIAD